MNTEDFTKPQLFSNALKNGYEARFGSDPLKGFRDRAWDHFLELDLPDRKQEAFQYLPLSQLYQRAPEVAGQAVFKPKTIPYLSECCRSHIVFVDGYYRPDLSNLTDLPEQVAVLPLDEAMRIYGTFLQNRLAKLLKQETDPFAALNGAVHGRGVFVFVPPKIQLKHPIQCIQLFSASESAFKVTAPRVHLSLGTGAKAEWISTVHGDPSEAVLVTVFMDAALDENASLTVMQTVFGGQEQWVFDAFRATLKKHCRLQCLMANSGSKTVRHSYKAVLGGEGSEADLKGIWMLSGRRQAHVHVQMEHHAPECRSMQLFKGINADASQSSFEGKILVQPEAQRTHAYQLNNHMLLGEFALANSKPNLEIFADDVKASHGATVAKLDPSQLFYLKTRGISEPLAKALLLQGFCKEIIDAVPYDSLKTELLDFVETSLKVPV